jgi:membrane-associated protease RseP (regulator of RpoE activity)
MENRVSSRKALFDTGIAGPLVSLVLSIPAIVIGIRFSEVIPASQVKEGAIRLADPVLFSFIHKLVMGDVPKNYELMVHPIAYAGWVGLFVTGLNLLPIGQLDGGHIAYALFGRRSRNIFATAIAVFAFFFMFYNVGWIVLLILMVLFGLRHPTPSDDETPLGWKRKFLGGISLVALVISFTPAPFPEAPSLVELIEKGTSTLWM